MTESIIPNDYKNICYVCGVEGRMEEHHIFGSVACRHKSERLGLKVHLCRKCHGYLHDDPDGYKVKDFLHQVGQKVYESQIGSREQFIEEFIRSYL